MKQRYRMIDDLIVLQNLDADAVYEYVDSVNLDKVNEKEKYLYKCIMNDLTPFKRKWKKPNFMSLAKALREKGFTGEDWEWLYICEIENHCITEFPFSVNQMIELNHSIVDFCTAKGNKTYGFFIVCLKGSKTLNKVCNVDYKGLEQKAKEQNEEWTNLLQELDAVETKGD